MTNVMFYAHLISLFEKKHFARTKMNINKQRIVRATTTVFWMCTLLLVLQISAVQGFSSSSRPVHVPAPASLITATNKKAVMCYQYQNTVHCRHERPRIIRTAVLYSTSSSSSSSLEYLETVQAGIIEFGFDLNDWEACGQLLSQQTGLDVWQAHDLLARAWNWKSWAVTTSKIARRYITPIEPSIEKVQEALTWLQGEPLQLTTPLQLATAIASDPVSYLIDPRTSYQQALKAAPIEYQQQQDDGDDDDDDKDKAFLALLREKPVALKNYYNCKDSGCNSECGNCWVSFQMAGEI